MIHVEKIPVKNKKKEVVRIAVYCRVSRRTTFEFKYSNCIF